MLVTERFTLNAATKKHLNKKSVDFGFGGLGAIVYNRTYSRQKVNANGDPTGEQEKWADTIVRTIEGMGSIRKWWYVENGIPWDEEYWQDYLSEMALAAFEMKWLPPGRGLICSPR